MKFIYTKITEQYYLEDSDEWEEDGIEFQYEPSDSDIKSALKELITDEYGEQAWVMVEDLEIWDIVAEYFEEQLAEYFKDEAMQQFE